MAGYTMDERVEITDLVCPVTFVKAKVAMEELEVGQVLAVTMNDGEPVHKLCNHLIYDLSVSLALEMRHDCLHYLSPRFLMPWNFHTDQKTGFLQSFRRLY